MIDASKISFRFPSSEKLIVAVSGGADSVALLDILHNAGYPCVVAHCNFHLRGKESDRDEAFVQSLAEKYGLPFRKIDFQTNLYASLRSLSIEMAARELRYEWFRQLLVREGAKRIVVAHHSDDVVETVLMNMSRGTGLRGLTGIKEVVGDVWRPLLPYSREDILNYLQSRLLPHMEDSTNTDTHYTRNRFRCDIIPMLQEAYPSFKKNILNTIEHLTQTENFLQCVIEGKKSFLFEDMNDGMYKISLSRLDQEKCRSFLLYELLSPYGFVFSTIEDVEESILSKECGKIFYSKKKDFVLTKDRDSLFLRPVLEEIDKEYVVSSASDLSLLPISLFCDMVKVTDLNIIKSSDYCYLDASKITFPFVLRKWHNGDWFVPFGMKGKKKLSDFLIDQKLSSKEKSDIWVLTKDESIVWVIGYRSDNRFRIDEKTENVFCFHLKNNLL